MHTVCLLFGGLPHPFLHARVRRNSQGPHSVFTEKSYRAAWYCQCWGCGSFWSAGGVKGGCGGTSNAEANGGCGTKLLDSRRALRVQLTGSFNVRTETMLSHGTYSVCLLFLLFFLQPLHADHGGWDCVHSKIQETETIPAPQKYSKALPEVNGIAQRRTGHQPVRMYFEVSQLSEDLNGDAAKIAYVNKVLEGARQRLQQVVCDLSVSQILKCLSAGWFAPPLHSLANSTFSANRSVCSRSKAICLWRAGAMSTGPTARTRSLLLSPCIPAVQYLVLIKRTAKPGILRRRKPEQLRDSEFHSRRSLERDDCSNHLPPCALAMISPVLTLFLPLPGLLRRNTLCDVCPG